MVNGKPLCEPYGVWGMELTHGCGPRCLRYGLVRLPVVGGPQRCWRAWEEIGAAPMWVSILREGLWTQVDQGFDIDKVKWGSLHARSAEQKRWMKQETLRLIATGAMAWCEASELLCDSGIFLLPKSGPKLFRQVVNMKPVNVG